MLPSPGEVMRWSVGRVSGEEQEEGGVVKAFGPQRREAVI